MSTLSCTYGRYLLLDEIARGGMAVVYRAVLRERSGFEKHVALKRVLRELSSDAEFVARFADEARIASTLNHSNIVQVFDFGQVEGEYFLAMELVDGPDLGALLACGAGPLPLPAALSIAAEAARGLGAAHRRQDRQGAAVPVVHRDVSPQNILVSRDGEVKVADFGIAKAAERALRTRTGLVLGKCRYLAPEQAAGAPVNATADVFAMGCVLFEMLVGRPLFDGATSSAILQQIMNAPLAATHPSLPVEVNALLARCLAREPQSRHADGVVLAGEIEALLHRMAPDFTSNELAAVVRQRAPAQRVAASWQAAVTLQDQPLVEATTVPLRSGSNLATASTVLALDRETISPTGEIQRAAVARRPILLLATAAVLGAVGGLVLRWQRATPMALSVGQQRWHAGWSIRLLGVERTSKLLGTTLALRPPSVAGHGNLGGLFSRLEGTHRQPVAFWSAVPAADDGMELHLAFRDRGRGGSVLLCFRPAGAGELILRLQP